MRDNFHIWIIHRSARISIHNIKLFIVMNHESFFCHFNVIDHCSSACPNESSANLLFGFKHPDPALFKLFHNNFRQFKIADISAIGILILS